MNNFLQVKSKNRATPLRIAARIISIMILTFLWSARGEAQTPQDLDVNDSKITGKLVLTYKQSAWYYTIGGANETEFTGTLTGTNNAWSHGAINIQSEKTITDTNDLDNYPVLKLKGLELTSTDNPPLGSSLFYMQGGKPLCIQAIGESLSTLKCSGITGSIAIANEDGCILLLDGGTAGLNIHGGAAGQGISLSNGTRDVKTILKNKVTITGGYRAVEIQNYAGFSATGDATTVVRISSGTDAVKEDNANTSSPFLEWTFASAPENNKTLEIRDASSTPITFTTDGKAKSFAINVTKNAEYTLWLDNEKQTASNGADVFSATNNKLFSFEIKDKSPANWTEYAQTAKVGTSGTDVVVVSGTNYTVKTPAGLAWIAWVTNEGKNNTDEAGKSYPTEAGFKDCIITLGNDISLDKPAGVSNNFDTNWPIIGNASNKLFKGTFDGGSHKVSGLSITTLGGQYHGFFGYIDGAVIKNLRVEGKIEGSSSIGNNIGVGGIVGNASNGSKIIACSNAVEITVTTTATSYGLNIGGIAGILNGSGIRSCWNEASLSGTSSQEISIGGIVGYSDSQIGDCYSSGPVSGTGTSTSACASGGIVGNIAHTVVSWCYATGSVSANNSQNGSTTSAGGIVGHINGASGGIGNCLALNTGDGITISANGSTSYVGRVVGQREESSLSSNYASTKIKLKKGSDPAAAPTTDIAANAINGADLYLDEATDAIAVWTGDGKAFTAIGTDEATGTLPQLKAVATFGTDGLPATYGAAISGQPAANMKSVDYLAQITALELPANSMGAITLSCTDDKWSYKKGNGASIRFNGTIKMAQGVTSSDIPLVVSSATDNPTLTFENVKLGSGDRSALLTINQGCGLTLHTTGEKPLTIKVSDSNALVNKGTLTLTGTGLWIEYSGPSGHYCLENSGTFTVSNPEETSVTFDSFYPTINNNNGTLGNAWIEWRYNDGGKIAFAAIDDTNQSPDAQTFKRGKIATPVTAGKTYRLWKVTDGNPDEVRTRQQGKKDDKIVTLFPAPAVGEVAVYTNMEDVKTITITDSKNFSEADCSGNEVTVGANGVLTIDNADAQVLNLTLEDGGQVVTTKPLKVKETLKTTRSLDNKWIAFGTPVALKASVAEDQLLYVGTGYNDTDPTKQSWENVSGITSDGTKSADLTADSPYLLAAETGSTEVTFAATSSAGQSLVIPETATVTPGDALQDGVFLFRTNPNLANLPLSDIYVLNADGTRFELKTGEYSVKPFEAYITANAVTRSGVRSLKIGGDIATGSEQPVVVATTRIWGTRGMLHISADAPADVMIVTPAGQILRTVKVPAGDTTLALPAGIYFVRCNDITYKVSL